MSDRHWDTAFDQADIDLLGSAFAKACQLVANDRVLSALDPSDVRKGLARSIMAMESEGERNPARLADLAIARLRQREQVARSAHNVAAKSGFSGQAA